MAKHDRAHFQQCTTQQHPSIVDTQIFASVSQRFASAQKLSCARRNRGLVDARFNRFAANATQAKNRKSHQTRFRENKLLKWQVIAVRSFPTNIADQRRSPARFSPNWGVRVPRALREYQRVSSLNVARRDNVTIPHVTLKSSTCQRYLTIDVLNNL